MFCLWQNHLEVKWLGLSFCALTCPQILSSEGERIPVCYAWCYQCLCYVFIIHFSLFFFCMKGRERGEREIRHLLIYSLMPAAAGWAGQEVCFLSAMGVAGAWATDGPLAGHTAAAAVWPGSGGAGVGIQRGDPNEHSANTFPWCWCWSLTTLYVKRDMSLLLKFLFSARRVSIFLIFVHLFKIFGMCVLGLVKWHACLFSSKSLFFYSFWLYVHFYVVTLIWLKSRIVLPSVYPHQSTDSTVPVHFIPFPSPFPFLQFLSFLQFLVLSGHPLISTPRPIPTPAAGSCSRGGCHGLCSVPCWWCPAARLCCCYCCCW